MMQRTDEEYNLLMLSLNIFMAEACWDNLRTQAQKVLIYKHDMKREVKLAMNHADKILNILQERFNLECLDWQNSMANDLYEINMKVIHMDEEQRIEIKRALDNVLAQLRDNEQKEKTQAAPQESA